MSDSATVVAYINREVLFFQVMCDLAQEILG